MGQNIFERINALPCAVFLDVIVDVAVGDDLVILVVDATTESHQIGIVIHSVEVIINDLHDLGAVSGTVFFGRHQECTFDHLFGSQTAFGRILRAKLFEGEVEGIVGGGLPFLWLVS